MSKLTLEDIDIKNKKILMRVDFNVPMSSDKTIEDDTRIKAALKSINYILNNGCSLILMSHLGRPKGKKDPKYSLKPVAKKLSSIINKNVQMAPDCIGNEVETLAKNLHPGEILLLENLRFYEAEEKPDKDPNFAKNLAKLAEIYVDDAFGAAHRKHSSICTITKHFPNKSIIGFLMQNEILHLQKIVANPQKPFYAIIGGSKISSKIGVINTLVDKVDALFIGGGMSYTFLKALNISVGSSVVELDFVKEAKNIMDKCNKKNVKLYLPLDVVIANDFNNDAKTQTIDANSNFPENWMGMSIGPKTVKQWTTVLQNAKTILWNGPLGVFEFSNFAKATDDIAKVISNIDCYNVVGGGDSISAINKLGIAKKFSHISTGGGASLEYIEFGTLPGIACLSDKK